MTLFINRVVKKKKKNPGNLSRRNKLADKVDERRLPSFPSIISEFPAGRENRRQLVQFLPSEGTAAAAAACAARLSSRGGRHSIVEGGKKKGHTSSERR